MEGRRGLLLDEAVRGLDEGREQARRITGGK